MIKLIITGWFLQIGKLVYSSALDRKSMCELSKLNITAWQRPCDGTYCRSVHIVVGDNMYRPSLHILSSIGTYCRRQKSYTGTYCRRRQYVPNLTAHIVAPQMLLLKDFFIVL